MTAQVYIVLAEAKNALTIPSAAVQTSNRPPRGRGQNSTEGSNAERTERPARAERNPEQSAERAAGERPKRLELNDQEKQLVAQGKASVSMVRVLQADGSAKATPVLIGLNNRATAQVIRGLKEGDQVVIADGSDTSNDAAKRGARGGSAGPMRM